MDIAVAASLANNRVMNQVTTVGLQIPPVSKEPGLTLLQIPYPYYGGE